MLAPARFSPIGRGGPRDAEEAQPLRLHSNFSRTFFGSVLLRDTHWSTTRSCQLQPTVRFCRSSSPFGCIWLLFTFRQASGPPEWRRLASMATVSARPGASVQKGLYYCACSDLAEASGEYGMDRHIISLPLFPALLPALFTFFLILFSKCPACRRLSRRDSRQSLLSFLLNLIPHTRFRPRIKISSFCISFK